MKVLSGLRPTGRLHLGHLVGVLNSIIELQKKADKCYFMIADWHALTTQYTDSNKIKDNSYLLLIHSLAVGIDPNKSIIFRQSDISEHLELSFIFSCFVPLGWLFRNPTYKEQKAELKGVDLSTYAFLGYPVLQAADILIYKAEVVPIGEDQKPHLELTREVARKFNRIWGEYFPYPEPYFAPHSKLPGLDNRKMSKSYNNCIYLDEEKDSIEEKIKNMYTDPKRIYLHDPGHPQECPVFQYHNVFNREKVEEIENSCKMSSIGCVACKILLKDTLNAYLTPIREKIKEIQKESDFLEDLLNEGKKKATEAASSTLQEVKLKIIS